jgi:competence protein ComEC
MTKSRIFLIFCVAFIVGIFFGRFIDYKIMAICAMIFIIAGTVWYSNKTVLIFAIAGVVALGGGLRFITDYSKNDLQQFYGETLEVSGIIRTEPDVRTDKIYLTLADVTVSDQLVKSKLLVSVPKYREFEYGEKLKFASKISEPKEYPDFSYKNYLSRYGIDAIVYQPQIELVDGNYGNPAMVGILNMKKKFVVALTQVLTEPQNSFLAGLLLGAKRSIPENITEQFVRTGMSHVVAVSGYNITIIAIGIGWLFQWFGLRKRVAFVISLVAIVTFVIMIGASASAVRAGVMGILLLLALNVERVSVASNALAFTAALMLIINPQILAFDVGFQLSFAAVIGIIYLIPILEKYFMWLPFVLRKYFLATLAAQIFTLPILLYYFGSLSVIALLPNLFVLPIIPIIMATGFITGILSLIYVNLAIPFAYVTKLLLSYALGIIDFFANLSFATVSININFWAVIIYYVIMYVILVRYYSLQKSDFLLEYTRYDNHK